ncbi:MAG: phage tail tape measure protein, partial [Zoogloeaceae bacterium]|nr:phage tail tape measure protein [Zoogloeaceae bacterium]
MTSSADVEIRLRLADNASQGLERSRQAAQKGAQRTATATERAAAKAAAASERGAQQQQNAFARLSQARERLGMRSEHAIQREIQRTQAAYNRLKASGTLSWREQARAAEQTRQRVTQLTNEMGRLTAKQKAMGALKIGAAGVAGIGAAAYAIKDPIQKAIDYDYRLAGMANTAFAERDLAGRRIGMKELEDAVNNAVKQGGGTRESAAEALDALIASGAVGSGDAMQMLPTLVKAATASGAEVSELANIGIRAMQSFGVTAEELPNILNMAISAGQAGGFELRDMARWLPQQMAAAKMSGMSGRGDFAAIAALNQAAAITAGTRDEAGNNVTNILRKINSQDTAADVKKVMGLDLAKYLQDSRGKGINSIDAFGALITRSVEKDKGYQALQTKLAGAKDDDEKRATLESMAAIAQGSGIGKIIQDQQA